MRKVYAFIACFILVLNSLMFPGCSKDEEEAVKEKEAFCNDIRNGLSGELVYVTKSNQVKRAAFHGSSVNLGHSVFAPRWSPDGQRIAIIENDNENIYVKIFHANGTPENSWILMSSAASSGDHSFDWSPDGTVIAILNKLSEIIYMNVSTGEKSVFQINQEGAVTRAIAWNSISNKMAITQFSGSFGTISKSISLINPYENFPEKEILVSTEEYVEYMDWSPDGSKLAYSGFGYGSVYIINSDGTNNQKIIAKGIFINDPVYGCAPCWMANGSQVIYEGVTGTEGSTLIPGLFVTDIEGSYNVDIEMEGCKPDCRYTLL